MGFPDSSVGRIHLQCRRPCFDSRVRKMPWKRDRLPTPVFLGFSGGSLPEKAMAPHSSTLAWKIPWMEEPGGLQSMGWLRVGHDWATSLLLFTFMHWRMKWQPTPEFLPGESQGPGSLVGCRLWGRTELATTEANLAAGGSAGKESTCNVGDRSSIPGLGRSPEERNGYPLQYSGLENSMDRGAWQAAVQGIAKSWTQLSDFHFHKVSKNKSMYQRRSSF